MLSDPNFLLSSLFQLAFIALAFFGIRRDRENAHFVRGRVFALLTGKCSLTFAGKCSLPLAG